MALDVPTTPTIEAASLSSLLDLASNPPAKPAIYHAGAAPLILYIARVPGSRDVFLTPIKPREKVVTAADVQSSLYYVHYNGLEGSEDRPDELLPTLSSVNTNASDLPSMSGPLSPKRKAVPSVLPRRPVPAPSPPYPADEHIAKPLLPPRPGSLRLNVPRKPVLPLRSPAREQELDLPILPPRPLPSAPPAYAAEPESPSLHDDNMRLLRRESHTDENANPYNRGYPADPSAAKHQDPDAALDPGSLTLIRRNANSNEQWNVATIHDPPIQEVSSSALLVPTAKRRTKRGGAPLYLDITNAGYAQFMTTDSKADSKISVASTSSSEESGQMPEGTFRCRLYMPGSKFASYTNGVGHHRFDSANYPSGEPIVPSSLRGERHSVDLGSLHPTNSNGVSSTRSFDKRSKGYTFTSPWQGQCEFTTGTTGTSLKCRHYLPFHVTGNGNVVQDVSELRFNLPSSAKSPREAFAGSRHGSYFTHHCRHLSEDGAESPTFVIDDEGRIDLSLGQERAGGGFGGKQAKLGKLIIEPAGFGMLDLLVAANLGLWWRAWERV